MSEDKDIVIMFAKERQKTIEQQQEIERLNNIIKEAKEYIENNSYFESNIVKTMVLKDYSNGILEILDKGE